MRFVIVALVTAGAVTLALPATAEDVYVRGPGIGVELGTGHRSHDRVVTERRVYRDDDFARGRCKTTIIKTDGMTKKIKKCR
jgi:hypothetical protein